MYKIGDFSKITQLTVKALRYYDEIGLLVPATVEDGNGYRIYDMRNYERAMLIQTLKKYDFSIQEMLEIVPQIEDSSDLAAYLTEKSQQVQNQIVLLKGKHNKLLKEVSQLKEESKMSQLEQPCIKSLDPILIASIRYKGKYEEIGSYLGQLFKAAGMNACGAPFALYHDGDFKEEFADIEVAVPVRKPVQAQNVTSRTLEAAKVVSLVHVGAYNHLSQSYKLAFDYINEHGYIAKSPCREHYIKGPGMLLKGNEDKYKTELQIPIES